MQRTHTMNHLIYSILYFESPFANLWMRQSVAFGVGGKNPENNIEGGGADYVTDTTIVELF